MSKTKNQKKNSRRSVIMCYLLGIFDRYWQREFECCCIIYLSYVVSTNRDPSSSKIGGEVAPWRKRRMADVH